MNPDAARAIGAAIEATQKFIGEHPRIGRLQKGRDLRKVVVPRFGYLIYYSVLDQADIVAIVTIRHPARARIVADL